LADRVAKYSTPDFTGSSRLVRRPRTDAGEIV
jgi:hypothetical protein